MLNSTLVYQKQNILLNLSTIDLCMLTAMAFAASKEYGKYNFEMIFHEYDSHVRQLSIQGISSSQFIRFSKNICFMAFQRLIENGLCWFVEKNGMIEYRMARTGVSKSVLCSLVGIAEMPDALKTWINSL